MPQFRRGAEEIEKSTQRASGGGFGKFAPSIYWKDDKEVKYLLFLNPIEDIPRLDMINFISVKNDKGEHMYFASVIARSDACFGEDAVKVDRLVEQWDAPIKDSNLFVAVELEPVMQEKRGREKPVGFTVKTVDYERRVRDDDDNLTDETETVTSPAYGFIQESASNFGAILGSHDSSEFPIHEWAVKIQRIGTKTDTKYNVVGYEEMEIDLDPFIDNIEGISYLGDELEGVKDAISELDPKDAVLIVGSVLLEARLNELVDEDRYNMIADGVTETLDKFGNKNKKKNGSALKTEKPSQRRSNTASTDNGNGASDGPKQRSPASMAALDKLKATAAGRAKTAKK